MTREEAIERLKNMAWLYGSVEKEQNIEAIDMAIEALRADVARWSSWNKTFEQSGIADLISRADVLRKLKRRKKFFIDAWGGFHLLSITDRSRVDELDACIAEVTNAPSADAVPVDRTSEWVAVKREEYENYLADRPSGEWTYLRGSIGSYMTMNCPFCGETFNDVAEWKYNYCPNCWAKMGGNSK